MPEIILPDEVTNEIDWSNPLTDDLEALLYCDGTNIIDAVTGEISTVPPSSTGTDSDGTWWKGMVDFDLRDLNVTQGISNTYIWYLLFGEFRTTSAGSLGTHIRWTRDGNSASDNVDFTWDGGWSTRYSKVAGNYGSDNLENTVYMGESLAYHAYGLRLSLNRTSRTYIYASHMLDGVKGQNNNAAQSASANEKYLFRIGSGYKTYIVPIFKQVTGDETKIAEVQANPYQLFKLIASNVETYSGATAFNISTTLINSGLKSSNTTVQTTVSTTNLAKGNKQAQAIADLFTTSNVTSIGNKIAFAPAQNNINSVIDTSGTKHCFGLSNSNITTSFTISGTAAELIIKSGAVSLSTSVSINSIGYKSSLSNAALNELTNINVVGYKYGLATANFNVTTNGLSSGIKASHGSKSKSQETVLNSLGFKNALGNSSQSTSTIVMTIGIGGSFVPVSRKTIIPGRINTLTINGQMSSGLTIQGTF